jgi:hypothetical protein
MVLINFFEHFILLKQINEEKENQMSIPCYQMKILFYNISFFRLRAKNAKECYT